jgi:aquaporin Z
MLAWSHPASGVRNVGANAALAIGGYIVLAAFWAAPVIGASMNPLPRARK